MWHGVIFAESKSEHQKPAGLLQPLPIPMWKWDEIGMDFVTGLPKTPKGNDAVWVIVDRLTKTAHFLPVRTNYKGARLAKLYIENINSVDRGTRFTSKFGKVFKKQWAQDFGTAYHPRTDGRTKRVNQVMEDMLRACALAYGANWEAGLPFASFRTTMGVKPVWVWRHLKLYMGENVEPH
ncbi:hypothetical protein U9M48_042490 [Paspalum notatum var. saurae]|uniref:Uncharacterized protein n=1 Tax=Paspalum notatum var. saurae TaxID=547442 RepID=A0AAQ3XG75_PASNO